jgi:AcrR family transcriptional regulator
MGPSDAAPRGRGVSVEDIVESGVTITAAEGLGAVTVRAVAGRLGVRSPSLYHHLPGGVEELRGLVVERIQAILESEEAEPEGAGTWDRLEVPLRAVGRATRSYPGVLEYILTAGKDGPTTLSGSDRTVQLLLDSELADLAPEAYVAIHAYVTGWVFAQRPTSAAAQAHGMTSLAAVLRAAEDLDQEQVLLDGLHALLSGLARAQQAPVRKGRARRPGRSGAAGRSRAG